MTGGKINIGFSSILVLIFLIFNIYNLNAQCNADFSYITIGDHSVSLVNNSDFNDAENVIIYWDLGDGNTSLGESVIHTYVKPGFYSITLIIISEDNCFDKITKRIPIGIDDTSPDCELYIFFETTNASLPSYNNGSAFVFGTGDYPGYYYTIWSTGNTGAIINNLSPGVYCVTVSKDHCYGSNCVEVGTVEADNEACNSGFTHHNYYSPGNDSYTIFSANAHRLIQFYYWDFGDGNESYQANPINYFSAPGTYEVCLTVETYTGCFDTYCDFVNVVDTMDFYADVSGQVFVGSNYLPQGMAILYRISGEKYSAIKKNEIINGQYHFENILKGDNYIIHLIPFFDLEDVYFPKYISSYSSSHIIWQESSLFILSEDTTIQTNLASFNEIYYNDGEISGKVFSNSDISYEGDIFSEPWFNQTQNYVQGTARNITVLLQKYNGNIIDFALTDFNGQFTFKNLEYAEYVVRTEKPGLTSDLAHITISESNNRAGDVEFYIEDESIVLSNSPIMKNEDYLIFPNPFRESLVISKNDAKKAHIYIYNLAGILVFEYYFYSDYLTIDASNFPAGVYTVNIKTGDQTVNKKLIKL